MLLCANVKICLRVFTYSRGAGVDVFKCLRCDGYTMTDTGDIPHRCGVCGKVRDITIFELWEGPLTGVHAWGVVPDPGPVVLRKRGGDRPSWRR